MTGFAWLIIIISTLPRVKHIRPMTDTVWLIIIICAKRQTASHQDQLRLFPFCSPAVGEDSPRKHEGRRDQGPFDQRKKVSDPWPGPPAAYAYRCCCCGDPPFPYTVMISIPRVDDVRPDVWMLACALLRQGLICQSGTVRTAAGWMDTRGVLGSG